MSTKNRPIHNIAYHFVWCPKYRRSVLTDKIEQRLKELLYEKAEALHIEIRSLEVMPDHVHCFIEGRPTLSPHYIACQLKGYSSKVLRKEFRSLKTRLPTLWTRAYYCGAVGHVSEETVKKYIENQKNK